MIRERLVRKRSTNSSLWMTSRSRMKPRVMERCLSKARSVSKVVRELAGIGLASLGEIASAEVKMESISCTVTRKTFGGLPGADIDRSRKS